MHNTMSSTCPRTDSTGHLLWALNRCTSVFLQRNHFNAVPKSSNRFWSTVSCVLSYITNESITRRKKRFAISACLVWENWFLFNLEILLLHWTDTEEYMNIIVVKHVSNTEIIKINSLLFRTWRIRNVWWPSVINQ